MSRPSRPITAAATLVLSFSLSLAAEAIIKGKIVDEAGKGVPSVKILVSDKSSGKNIKGESEDDGTYYMRGIPPADYEITFEKEGFTSHAWVGHLAPGKAEIINATLQSKKAVAAATEAQAAAVAAEDLGKDFNAGVERFNAKDYDGAIAAFTKVVEKSPGIPDPYYNIGLCYQKKKDPASAGAWLTKAIEKKPDHRGAHFNLSFALFAQGKSAEGLGEAEKVVEIDASADAAYDTGVLLKNWKQDEKAFEMFKKAVERDASYADAHRELGYLYLGRNDGGNAKQSLAKYVELQPASPDAAEVRAVLDQIK